MHDFHGETSRNTYCIHLSNAFNADNWKAVSGWLFFAVNRSRLTGFE